jgi:uncharacterized membrane protein YtjA (UPF0391 family)
MFYWAFIFLIVGVLASMMGFGGLGATAFGIAKGLVLLKIIGLVLLVAAVGFAVAGGRGRLPH